MHNCTLVFNWFSHCDDACACMASIKHLDITRPRMFKIPTLKWGIVIILSASIIPLQHLHIDDLQHLNSVKKCKTLINVYELVVRVRTVMM